MKIPEDMYCGATHSTNQSGILKVIKYNSSVDVVIVFVATGYATSTQSSKIRSGSVKDIMKPVVFGFGFFGEGSYKSQVRGKMTREYSIWKCMIRRCYDKASLIKHPTYVGCTVCESWLNFQVFAEWFEENYIDGCHLDKDIKVKGNKVYGPDTCMFTSQSNNNVKASAKRYEFVSPTGSTVDVYNLSEFCRENELDQRRMSDVHMGLLRRYKGYQLPSTGSIKVK